MWGAIDWSWQQLVPVERWVLAQCCVFRESFDIEAAIAVVESVPLVSPRSLRDIVIDLVEKSLIHAFQPEPGYPRLSLLRSVREYAAERLADPASVVDNVRRAVTGPNARAALEARHRHYFAYLDGNADVMAFERSPRAPFNGRFSDHAENVYAAMTSALSEGESDLAARAWVLAWYGGFSLRGPFLSVAERSGELAQAPRLTPQWRGWLRYIECMAWRSAGHYPLAVSAGDAGLVALADSDDKTLEALLRSARAAAAAHAGHWEAIRAEYDRALATHREAGDEVLVAKCLTRIGLAHLRVGATANARATLMEALTIHGQTQNRRFEGITAGAIGRLEYTEGAMAAARMWFEEALTAFEEVGDQRHSGQYRVHCARLDHALGDPESARRSADAAAEIHRRVGDALGEADAMTVVAALDVDAGLVEVAETQLRRALKTAQMGGDLLLECRVRGTIGRAALSVGDLNLAERALSEAVQRCEGLSAPLVARLRGDLAVAYARMKRVDDAMTQLAKVEDVRGVSSYHLGCLLCRRAEVEFLAGGHRLARAALLEAAVLTQRLGVRKTSPLSKLVAEITARFAPTDY
jgi:tetratricopeptide (TPR) repeat protein